MLRYKPSYTNALLSTDLKLARIVSWEIYIITGNDTY